MTSLSSLIAPWYKTADSTAIVGDVRPGKTAYVSGGKVTGTNYRPAMMEYDGAATQNQLMYTSSGNKLTHVIGFCIPEFTGNKIVCLIEHVRTVGGVAFLTYVHAHSSDYADADRANTILAGWSDLVSTNALLFSRVGFLDGNPHTLMVSFDGDVGSGQLIIDGESDDTGNADRIAPTTGTMNTGSSTYITLGNNLGATQYLAGDLGYFGFKGSYLTNWSDFMDANGNPKEIDESGWTEWGSQPLAWNPHGDVNIRNFGSLGTFTKTGNIYIGDRWT